MRSNFRKAAIVRRKKLIWTCVALSMIGASGLTNAQEPYNHATANHPYTISKTTTFVDGPLVEDGSIDFVAAINQVFSRGVTAENNAACTIFPLIEADEPWEANFVDRDRFMTEIGAKPSSIRFSSLWEDARQQHIDEDDLHKKLRELEGKGFDSPPTDRIADFGSGVGRIPELDNYIDTNAEAFERLVEGARLPKWYLPIAIENRDRSLGDNRNAATSFTRGMCQLLAARATQRIKTGQLTIAWSDILAIKRIGSLLRQGSDPADSVHASVIDNMACFLAALVLSHPDFADSMNPAEMLAEWSVDQNVDGLKRQVNFSERLALIQMQIRLAEGEGTPLETVSGMMTERSRTVQLHEFRKAFAMIPQPIAQEMVSGGRRRWDAGLTWINRYNDKLLEVLDEDPDMAQKELDKIFDTDLDQYRDEIKPIVDGVLSGNIDETELGERFAKFCHSILTTGINSIHRQLWMASDNQKVVGIALATRVFMKKNDRAPETMEALGDLVPAAWKRHSLNDKTLRFQVLDGQIQISNAGWDGEFGRVRKGRNFEDDWTIVIEVRSPAANDK